MALPNMFLGLLAFSAYTYAADVSLVQKNMVMFQGLQSDSPELPGKVVPEAQELPEKEDDGKKCDMIADWGGWGDCTKTCDAAMYGEEPEPAGKKVRHRHVKPLNCARSFEEMACPNKACPVDCVVSEWADWGPCDGECENEGARQNRTRKIVVPPDNGGLCCPEIDVKDCDLNAEPECRPALLMEFKKCGGQKEMCKPSMWTEWSSCSQTCNTGKKERTRMIETPAKCGGAPCLCDFLEITNCKKVSCVQECELSTWSEWSKCPVTCGGSVQTRNRTVITAPGGGAPDCGPLVESKNCAKECCEGDCVLSSWTPWTFCSASCYGTQKRTRKVEVTPCGTGKACDSLFESRECNHDCVLPCEVGEWDDWGECSATCGGGSKMRSRKVTQLEANGGENCPPLWETECCEESNVGCPADGEKKPPEGNDNQEEEEEPPKEEGNNNNNNKEEGNNNNNNKNDGDDDLEIDISSGLKTTTAPPGPSKSTTVPPGPSKSTTVPPGPSKSTTAPPGPSKSTTVPPGPSKSTTVPPGPSKSTTAPPGPQNDEGDDLEIEVNGSISKHKNETHVHHHKNVTETSSHHTNKTTSHSKESNATHKKETKTSKTVSVSKKTTKSVEITRTVTISSTTELHMMLKILNTKSMTVSKNISMEGVMLHKGDELIDAFKAQDLEAAKLPLALHFSRTEGGRDIKGKEAETKTIVSSQKSITFQTRDSLENVVEFLGEDLKVMKSVTADGWVLQAGDELLKKDHTEDAEGTEVRGIQSIDDLFEIKVPAKLTFQRSGTTVEAWKKSSSVKKKTSSTVVVSHVVTISDADALEFLMEHLDDDSKVVQGFSHAGLVLDKGDELLAEGAMAEASDIGDLLDLKLPAKLVFKKSMKQSSNEATRVTKTGHTITKSVKTIEKLDKMSEDEYYRHLDEIAKSMGKGDDADEYYNHNEANDLEGINLEAEDD